jgi:hypothetical protein
VRVPLREGEVELADGDGTQPPRLRWQLREPLAVRVAVPGRQVYSQKIEAGNGSKVLEN